MPPAIVAVVAAVATVAVKVYVTSQILAAILMVAISVAATALTKKPKRSYNQGQELRLKLDPNMPRQIALGNCATGGSLVWAFTYTDNGKKPNRYLVRIIQLSDLPIDQVVTIREGNNVLTFSGDVHTGLRACDQHRAKNGSVCMWAQVYKGSATATADANLISWSGGVWTANHKGNNCAYVILRYDNDADAFPGGEPQLIFTLRGAHLYDERYDSTVGGSGSQRLADPSTWTFSNNASVLTTNILRGLFAGGVLLFGAQAEARDLKVPQLMAAHNVCDQTVAISSGFEPLYTAGLLATCSDPTSIALLDLQAAFDGRIIDRGGSITVRPGASHTPVLDLTDEDVVWSEQKSWQPRSSLSDLTNHVTGSYLDGLNSYEERSFPPVKNAAWEAEDGGERFTTNLALKAVFSDTQAQRISQRVALAGRYQGTVAFAIPISNLDIEQGDWFTMTSARWGFTLKYFEVATCDIVAGDSLMLAITGREISSTFSSWDHTTDEVPRGDTTWTSPTYALLAPTLSIAPYYSFDAGTLKETIGLAIIITDMSPQQGGNTIEVELSDVAGQAVTRTAATLAGVDQTYILRGLMPSKQYWARARTSDGRRYSDWTAWQTTTTSAADSTIVDTVDAVNDPTTGLDAAHAAISAMDAVISGVDADITALQADMLAAETNIYNAQGDIVSLQTTQTTQGTQISTNATNISNTAGNLATLTTKVLAGNPNLLKNGGFEDGLTGWTQINGVWQVANPTTAVYGVHAYCAAADNGGTMPNTILRSDFIPVTAGLQYTLSGDIRSLNLTAGSARMDVQWYQSNQTTLILDDNDIQAAAAQEFYPTGLGRSNNVRTYTAPAGAAFAKIRLFNVSGTAGTQMAFRQVKFELGAYATAFTSEASVVQSFKAIDSVNGSLASLSTTVGVQGASITSNATAISNTNTNLATLEIQVDAIDVNVTNNITATNTLTSNLAAITTELRTGAFYLNPNQGYGAWTNASAPPDNYFDWIAPAPGGTTRSRVVKANGGYAVRETVTNTTGEIGFRTASPPAGGMITMPPGWYVIAAEAKLISGSLSGAAVHLQGRDASNTTTPQTFTLNLSTDPDQSGVAPGAGVAGRTYRWSKLVQFTNASVAQGILYNLTNWSSLTRANKSLDWNWTGVRAATPEEIARQTVLAPMETTVSNHTTSINTLGTNYTSMNTTLNAIDAQVDLNVIAISTLNSSLGSLTNQVTALGHALGGNLLSNTDFAVNANGWGVTATSSPNGAATLTRNLSAPSWQPYGDNTIGLMHTSLQTYNSGTLYAAMYNTAYISVAAGTYYEASVYAAMHRCRCRLRIEWWDATTVIGASDQASTYQQWTGGQNIANWGRMYVRAQAPVGAVKARLLFIKYGSEVGGQDSYAWITRPQFKQTDVLAPSPVDYSPANAAASILSLDASIQTNATGLQTALARAAITLDVNGYITGWEINNNGTTGEMIIRTDKFSVANSTGRPFEVVGSQVRLKDVKIGTLQVDNYAIDTLQMNTGAVTAVSSYYNAADYYPGYGTWETIGSLAVSVLSGYSVDVNGSFVTLGDVSGIPAGSVGMYGSVRLLRDSTLIASGGLPSYYFATQFGNFVFATAGSQHIRAEDTPGAGTFVYYMQVFKAGAPIGANANNQRAQQRLITARIFKR